MGRAPGPVHKSVWQAPGTGPASLIKCCGTMQRQPLSFCKTLLCVLKSLSFLPSYFENDNAVTTTAVLQRKTTATLHPDGTPCCRLPSGTSVRAGLLTKCCWFKPPEMLMLPSLGPHQLPKATKPQPMFWQHVGIASQRFLSTAPPGLLRYWPLEPGPKRAKAQS